MTEKDKQYFLKLFGSNVRKARRYAGLSQEALANKAGIDRSYMGAIERGQHNLALLNIIKICKALGVSPSELFESFVIRKSF